MRLATILASLIPLLAQFMRQFSKFKQAQDIEDAVKGRTGSKNMEKATKARAARHHLDDNLRDADQLRQRDKFTRD